MNVAIINLRDVGNIGSISHYFRINGFGVRLIKNALEVGDETELIVIPGVGVYSRAMESLEQCGFVDLLKTRESLKLLGICLGAQVLCEKGFEASYKNFQPIPGLGLLAGECKRIENVNLQKASNIGWRPLEYKIEASINQLKCFFMHSYAIHNFSDSELIASFGLGGQRFPAIYGNKRCLGMQFHPEKSGRENGAIISDFIKRYFGEG